MKLVSLGMLLGALSLPGVSGARTADPVADPTASMNQMGGTIQSVDTDNKVIHLQTENGFNVQFAYDLSTVCKGIGVSSHVQDLAFKDQVIIHYVGRDLLAREIEKRSLQPAVAASSPTSPAN